ncbi:DEAD/DEAH box helicase family protein [Celerinatantimonas sp. YJH-8]|uniref:DEAD/DEAH box helicase family protein n=1 Tax=Celerinatantimonas sp. YJH-8 TaxID=3228714 RepID=UPI0038C48F1E
MFQLRDYQQQAVHAVIQHFRHSDESALIVLPTGAGKSLVIAELARLAHYPVLVLAHVSELVEQNASKYQALGQSCSIYAAGLKSKNTDFPICFGSIQSVANNLNDFSQYFSLVIIDECHRVNAQKDTQYQRLLTHLKQFNPHLKVLGLTATPYRLNQGWCYEYDYRGFVRPVKEAAFKHCIYELPLRVLITRHYLTPPRLIDAAIAEYKFDDCQNNRGIFEPERMNHLLQASQRVTQSIIQQIVDLSLQRQGIMIFAATVEHAQEIMGYLANESAGLVIAETPSPERARIIQQFKNRTIKFLVNVSVLTTGFDAPHVDFIAILRPTESVSLFQQIIGRGLRLSEGKQECLVIDYAGNGFDIYQPEIGSPKPDSDSVLVQIKCPECGFENNFWGHISAEGEVLEHFGRRCQGIIEIQHQIQQCHYRFRYKQCPQCLTENDIAARICQHCKYRLIDPDDLLKKALNLKDAKIIRCSGMSFSKQNNILIICYYDEDGMELKEKFNFSKSDSMQKFIALFGKRQWQTPIEITHIDQVLNYQHQFRHPDFVIARKSKNHYWNIQERIFDYQGRYRLANQLH